MAKRDRSVADVVLETPESTVLDLIDELLNKGVMADGDVTLGVAGIDLIYLRLSALLCAADRIMPRDPDTPKRRRRHRPPGSQLLK
ncbi:MAG: hypothetical protein AUH43_11630 [Acidobacteria bacterium 13_1_40CM_65_14]|nr:MAG: hypothetical protein AUH43_11630 [Acidobacteria bacterium 13_1_40CM_65_14]OLC80051.1 MAG: hypothetical protein AUH72_12865 [Acidobacteria bacterium 13_1_40CM_4_65_8]OLD18710.1 MAG: hypothetical protein AUJ01_07030 [Acidobacteria bacterium 13_1_40CM_3_65_5]